MNAICLMYHDVTPQGHEDSSGFPGGDAARYKLTPAQFENHLQIIAECVHRPPIGLDRLVTVPDTPLLLTFDDGGESAVEYIAGALERRSWRGHFFVTSGYVGRPGFLSGRQVRELRRRGHIIGSHSHTHPLRMARCPERRVREEWARSVHVLADVLGEAVDAASVPGGYHSSGVTRMAAEAGIRVLFTSQPTIRVHRDHGVWVLGRYALQRSMSARLAAGIAAGDLAPRVWQAAVWNAKQMAKTLGGPLYLRTRERILGRSTTLRWGDEVSACPEDPR